MKKVRKNVAAKSPNIKYQFKDSQGTVDSDLKDQLENMFKESMIKNMEDSQMMHSDTVVLENNRFPLNKYKSNIKEKKWYENSGKYIVVKVKSAIPVSHELWSNCFTNSHFGISGYGLEAFYPVSMFNLKFKKSYIGVYKQDPFSARAYDYVCFDEEQCNSFKDDLTKNLKITNHDTYIPVIIKKIQYKNIGHTPEEKLSKILYRKICNRFKKSYLNLKKILYS